MKHLNNRIESDHGKFKQCIRPMRGFQLRKTARTTPFGFEAMRMLLKGVFRSAVDSLADRSPAPFIAPLFPVFVA